jgi:hypothetical protein
MNDSQEHDEVWNLLGRGTQPVAPPFFTRNVLRTIRTTPEATTSTWFLIPRWVCATVLAFVVAGFAASLPEGSPPCAPAQPFASMHPLFDRIAGIQDMNSIAPISPEEFAGL